MDMVKSICVGTCFGMVLYILATVGEADLQEEVSQAEQYCAMVQRYQETAGREGWPDYKSTYSELCDD